jgi:hypothetical protein
MKKLVIGAAIAGAAAVGLRAAARRGRQICAEHCSALCGSHQQCNHTTHKAA